MKELLSNLAYVTLEMQDNLRTMYLPTAQRCHYMFTMTDMTMVFRYILLPPLLPLLKFLSELNFRYTFLPVLFNLTSTNVYHVLFVIVQIGNYYLVLLLIFCTSYYLISLSFLLLTRNLCLTLRPGCSHDDLLLLWKHECDWVYSRRLIDAVDKERYQQAFIVAAKKRFTNEEQVCLHDQVS